MKRVTGVGGIFFKSRDPKALGAWYKTHLGIDLQPWGGAAFHWKGPDNPEGVGTTVWSLFPGDTKYFAPSEAPFMVNYRVADLHALLATLRSEGVQVEDKVDESEYGKFGWVIDPEGNKIELWHPPMGSEPVSTAVSGMPRTLLRIEGCCVLVAAILGYHELGASWLLFALLLLVPDVTLLGYLAGPRLGAIVYNAGHTYLAPAVLAGLSYFGLTPRAWPICLIWVAHIGLDRALGLGLKFASAFRDTHLGRVGPAPSAPA